MNTQLTKTQFSFGERMAMSNGVVATCDVAEVLKRMIPGAKKVNKSSAEDDKRGVDWWVDTACGDSLAVDAKVREMDYSLRGSDDLALETWSVVGQKIGWTLDESKRCDFVVWLWKDTGRFCLMSFPMLCHAFRQNVEAWRTAYRPFKQRSVRGSLTWESECVFVPRSVVWRAIEAEFGSQGSIL